MRLGAFRWAVVAWLCAGLTWGPTPATAAPAPILFGVAHAHFFFFPQFYVDEGAPSTNTACRPRSPCATVAQAVTAAEDPSDAGLPVYIYVGPGDYDESGITLDAANLGSLNILGSQSGVTELDAQHAGSVFTVTGGGSAGAGGEVFIGAGAAALTDDSFVDGDAAFAGGGLYVSGTGASATIANSTFVDDGAQYGGAIAVEGHDFVSAIFDTFVGDSSDTKDGPDIAVGGGTVEIGASIIGDGCAALEGGEVEDFGYNVEADTSCIGAHPSTGLSDVGLGVGYPIQAPLGLVVVPINPNSPAFDEVPSTAVCQVPIKGQDELGDPRPGITGEPNCDAGAYELQHTPIPLDQAVPKSATLTSGPHPPLNLAVTTPAVLTGLLTWTVTTSHPAFTVTASGALVVPRSLKSRTYTIAGRVVDSLLDEGTWTFTLHVR